MGNTNMSNNTACTICRATTVLCDRQPLCQQNALPVPQQRMVRRVHMCIELSALPQITLVTVLLGAGVPVGATNVTLFSHGEFPPYFAATIPIASTGDNLGKV